MGWDTVSENGLSLWAVDNGPVDGTYQKPQYLLEEFCLKKMLWIYAKAQLWRMSPQIM